jgi:hypothetical protein
VSRECKARVVSGPRFAVSRCRATKGRVGNSYLPSATEAKPDVMGALLPQTGGFEGFAQCHAPGEAITAVSFGRQPRTARRSRDCLHSLQETSR